jgi:hypothetical protein
MAVKNEFEGIWTEAVVAYFKSLPQIYLKGKGKGKVVPVLN